MLYSLFSKIWEKEEGPAQWKEGIIIKLPKKETLGTATTIEGSCSCQRQSRFSTGSTGEDEGGCRPQAPTPAGRLPAEQILCQPDSQPAHNRGKVTGVDRETIWKLLRHYGVPKKIISLIWCTFQDMSCRIAHAGQLSESFEVKTGVRQVCLLSPFLFLLVSPFLFLLVIDWIMKTTTTGRNNGMQWTLWTQLDDLDFADDLALLSHNHSQMQDKTGLLETTSAGTGLKINRKKTEPMEMNTTANTPVTVGGEPIREVESFVYLGSVVDHQGGTDRDITARISKARAAFVMLKNI